MIIKVLSEALFSLQPFPARNKRNQYKDNRDPGKCRLISGQANREEDKSKEYENR